MSEPKNKIAISLRGDELDSVFELLGKNENSITYSLGWVLSRSPALLTAFSRRIGAKEGDFDQVLLQKYEKGVTDIELLGPGHHVIIEAKRGWWLPSMQQWEKYAPRFETEKRLSRTFVAMSDCTADYAALHLPTSHNDIPIRYIGWRDLETMTKIIGTNHTEKRLLIDLRIYLRKVATMPNVQSNMVYVVSLGSGVPEGGSLSWIDIVREKGRYFHPVGQGWPKEPPNYLAFRYKGQLQCIHHVDSYKVSTDSSDMPGLPPSWDWSGKNTPAGGVPHFLYTLGPAIIPPRTIRTGNGIRQAARVSVMLDLLLTSETITDAYNFTKKRLAESNDTSA